METHESRTFHDAPSQDLLMAAQELGVQHTLRVLV